MPSTADFAITSAGFSGIIDPLARAQQISHQRVVLPHVDGSHRDSEQADQLAAFGFPAPPGTPEIIDLLVFSMRGHLTESLDLHFWKTFAPPRSRSRKSS